MEKKDNNSISLAGEFMVLAYLTLHGYDANMTLGHTKGVDILAAHYKTRKMYKLEVKTKYRKSSKEVHVSRVHRTTVGGWIMDKKHETMIDPALFYCFVLINAHESSFQFYVIPSKIVARYVKKQHEFWLMEKHKEGKKVKDSDMRTFRLGFKGNKYGVPTPYVEAYENNWNFWKRVKYA
jgi:hypothetical protein